MKIFRHFLVFSFLLLSFMTLNFAAISPISKIDFDRLDSQFLVVGALNSSDYPINGFGLGASVDEGITNPYISQIGAQGYLFRLAAEVGCDSLTCLKGLNAFIFCMTLTALLVLIAKRIDLLLAIILGVTYLSSPWLTLFARDLYWIPFSWLLPMLIVLWRLVEDPRKSKNLSFPYVMLFLAFVFKFSSGYEYITTIILLAASPILMNLFISDSLDSQKIKRMYIKSALVFITGASAFVFTLLIHANLRGRNILVGLRAIYLEDVQRRTYGDASKFDAIYSESLNVSTLDVVIAYVKNWSTNLFEVRFFQGDTIALGGRWLISFLIFCAISVLLKFFLNSSGPLFHSRLHNSGLMLFLYVVTVPVSWFIAAKAHAYSHPHINYILWYLITIPAVIWILIKNVKFLITSKSSWPNLKQLVSSESKNGKQ